jgi:hypothetical protein
MVTIKKILAKATEAEATMVEKEAMTSTTPLNSNFACRLSFALLAAHQRILTTALVMNTIPTLEHN